jgi:hypothetical protein
MFPNGRWLHWAAAGTTDPTIGGGALETAQRRVHRYLFVTLSTVLSACSPESEPGRNVSAHTAALETRGCTEDQANFIGSGWSWAGLALLTASKDLENVRNGGDASRFDTWFGGHSEETLNFVTGMVESIYDLMELATLDCGCNIPDDARARGINETNAVAHSDPSKPFIINLCPLYFEQARSGDNFLEVGAGVLVHELTHHMNTLDQVPICQQPNCDDHPASALRAVTESPKKVLLNADNYMYYVLDWNPETRSTMTCRVLNSDQCD